MIEIKRNHFLKRREFETGVNISPLFADLPSSTASTATLGTNASQNVYVMGTTIPDLPTYGDAEIVGGHVGLYVSNITQKDSRSTPQLTSFRINPDLTVAEGTVSLAPKGKNLSVINSSPYNEIPYLEEEFEGDPAELETVSRLKAGSIVTKVDAWVGEDDLKDLIIKDRGEVPDKNEWKVYWKGLVKLDGDLQGTDAWGGIYTGWSGSKARVSFKDANHTRWTVQEGYKQKWFQGLKEYKDRKSGAQGHQFTQLNVIKYNVQTSSPNPDWATEANLGNTIFDDFYASRNFSNPYDASNSDPMMMSHIELSTDAALNGGQSLRFYHNWGYSPYNPQLQAQLGRQKNLNPQCARVSLYDIPYPSLAFDAGRTTIDAESSNPVLGDTRAVVPEIRMPMNISKLSPNVLIACEKWVNGADPVATIDPPIAHLKFPYGSTTSAPATSLSLSTSGPASKFEQTFLRSVVVTFSNYKPKPSHTTVDKFLNYGLTNFYRGKNYDNIVGGYVITRFGIDGADSSSTNMENCFAFPLPVTRAPQMGSSNAYNKSTNGNDYILRNGGMAKFQGDGVMSNLDIMTWGRSVMGDASNQARMRHVELPMNSWFTSRIFTDIYQHNNSGSSLKNPYGPTTTALPSYGSDGTLADIGKRGSAMRVIFEVGGNNPDIVSISGSTYFNVEGEPSRGNVRNLPFLDIPFPIGHSSDSSSAYKTTSYSFAENPELYPKHMTIWVQNYCWVSGVTDVAAFSSSETYDSLFYAGEGNVTASGATREAEVFVDSVKLLNYEPRKYNATAINKNSSINFAPQQINSPIATRYLDGTSNQYWINSWTNSGKVDYTVNCHVSGSGDSDKTIVKIQDPSDFDITFLENGGTINVTQADGGTTKIPASTVINSLNTLDTFTINQNPNGASPSTLALKFTSTGTLLPPVNKADMNEYNVGQNLVIGFNATSDLPTVTATKAEGFILFNDFGTTDWSGMAADPALPTKTAVQQATNIGGIYSQKVANNAIDALGGQLVGTNVFTSGSSTSNISGASYPVSGTSKSVVSGTSLGTGSNNDFISVDGFRQKGFIKLGYSGSDAANFGKWVKRENILTSTRVKSSRDKSVKNNHIRGGYTDDIASNQLLVADSSIFNYFDDEETYVLYLVGAPDSTASKKTGLILDRTVMPLNDVVTFTNLTTYADDGTTPLTNEDNLYRLMISPEKFSISMLFDTSKTRIPRSYTSACTVSTIPDTGSMSVVSGSTLNEFVFNYDKTLTSTGGASGLYKNVWSLIPDPDNRTLIQDVDYGYGEFDAETQIGGYYFRGPAYLDYYNCYPLTHLTDPPQTNFNLTLFYDNDNTYDEDITIETDDSATAVKRPTLYVEYKDLPPVIADFSVRPTVYTLDENFNYYDITDANLNSVTFSWEEENADDIWYRMLLIDDVPISNKYHQAITYLPLNESKANLNAAPVGEVNAYNMTTGDSVKADATVTVGTDVRKVPYGQGGWAVQLANTTNGKIKYTGTTAIPGIKDLTEYTLVVHWTPSAADDGVVAYVLSAGTHTYGSGDMELYKDANNKLIYKLGGSITMTGSKSIKCDGDTPTSIIITFKAAAKASDRLKVFIDGRQEAESSTTTTITNNPLILGGDYASGAGNRGTTGLIEELIIYDKAYDVVESAGSYVYSTVDTLDESASGKKLVHSAQLIAADYHNFRGVSKAEIGMSQSTSWRTTY